MHRQLIFPWILDLAIDTQLPKVLARALGKFGIFKQMDLLYANLKFVPINVEGSLVGFYVNRTLARPELTTPTCQT